jgi:hypothetical protein
MPDREQYVGTAFVLLAYLAEKSTKEGKETFPLTEVTEDLRKIRSSCKDTHLLSPDLHLLQCLDMLDNPLSLVKYDLKKVKISQLGICIGQRKHIPEPCRRYIKQEWGD